MALNYKQQRFVEEYLIDLNATQAAIRAGYSAKTAQEQGSRLLSNVILAEEVQKRIEARMKRTEVSQDEVINDLRELRDIAMGRKAIRVTEVVKDGAGGVCPFDFDVHVLEANAAKGAIELLGKHIGMFKDKLQLSGDAENPVQVVTLTPADYKAARSEMLKGDDV